MNDFFFSNLKQCLDEICFCLHSLIRLTSCMKYWRIRKNLVPVLKGVIPNKPFFLKSLQKSKQKKQPTHRFKVKNDLIFIIHSVFGIWRKTGEVREAFQFI